MQNTIAIQSLQKQMDTMEGKLDKILDILSRHSWSQPNINADAETIFTTSSSKDEHMIPGTKGYSRGKTEESRKRKRERDEGQNRESNRLQRLHKAMNMFVAEKLTTE